MGLWGAVCLACLAASWRAALRVSVAQEIPEYRRSAYRHWSDFNGDGQDTRQEVLIAESLVPVATSRDGKRVLSGRWCSPYSGECVTDPKKLDVDHVVALRASWYAGAWAWTPERREEYANYLEDPDHLVAVIASENRSKGAKTADEWMPERGQCGFSIATVRIKERWGLTYTDAEKDALLRAIGTCPPALSAAEAK